MNQVLQKLSSMHATIEAAITQILNENRQGQSRQELPHLVAALALIEAEMRAVEGFRSNTRSDRVDGPPLTAVEKIQLQDAIERMSSRRIRETEELARRVHVEPTAVQSGLQELVNTAATASPSGLHEAVTTEPVAGPSGMQEAPPKHEAKMSVLVKRHESTDSWASDSSRWERETLPAIYVPIPRIWTRSASTEERERQWDVEDEIPLSIVRERMREPKACTVMLRRFDLIEWDSIDTSSIDDSN